MDAELFKVLVSFVFGALAAFLVKDRDMAVFKCDLWGGPMDGATVNRPFEPRDSEAFKLKSAVHPSYLNEYLWNSGRHRFEYSRLYRPEPIAPAADCLREDETKR